MLVATTNVILGADSSCGKTNCGVHLEKNYNDAGDTDAASFLKESGTVESFTCSLADQNKQTGYIKLNTTLKFTNNSTYYRHNVGTYGYLACFGSFKVTYNIKQKSTNTSSTIYTTTRTYNIVPEPLILTNSNGNWQAGNKTRNKPIERSETFETYVKDTIFSKLRLLTIKSQRG